MATAEEEVAEFNKRHTQALAELAARSCTQVGKDFETAATRSKAGIGRALNDILALVGNPSALYASFYRQIDAGTRMPEDNAFDLRQESVDARFFPNFHKEVVFGALTLDGSGVAYYGGATMILREEAIALRATVFHENTILFFDKHELKYSDPIPGGYRAAWGDRGRLALAKLHFALDVATSQDEFPGILLRQKTENSPDDFVEVHIYQGFSRGAIEKIVCTKGRNKFDNQMLKALSEKAVTAGITIEVV